MSFLDKFISYLNKILMVIAGLALIALTGVAVANMFLRLIHMPVQGSYELIGFFGAIAAALALGQTQIRRDHIIVDILTNHFSKRANHLLDSINYLVNTIFFGTISWQMFLWGLKIWNTGELSETLKMIFHPFIFCVCFGLGFLSLILFIDFLKSLKNPKEDKA